MTATMISPTNTKKASPSKLAAIDQIHLDLDQMVSRLRRQIWTCATLAAGTTVIVSLLTMLVVDAVFRPESTWLRILLWLPLVGVVAIVTRRLLIVPLKEECDRLAMAWTLEQKRPTIEERLTTSLQLTGTPHCKTSSLVEAVAQQAHGSLIDCQEETLRGQEILRRTIIAGACFTAFVLSLWIWAPWMASSLQNVLNPWNSRVLPRLNAMIVPGNTLVGEGEELRVTATANRLSDAVIEVLDNDAVITTHQMTSGKSGTTAEFTLTNLKRDFQYRVRAGGLYSDRYQIFVDPKPVIMSSQINLAFPEYTQRPPQVINDPVESIEVIQGTRIRIDADVQSNLPPAESTLNFDGTSTPCKEVVAVNETDLWRHRWEFTATARDLQRGTITLVSKAGVVNDPFAFEVQILPDLPPSIAVEQPALSDVIATPEQNIDIAYQVLDDFGCSRLHLNTQRNSEPPSVKVLQHLVQPEFTGELTVNLSELEFVSGDQLTVWLSITDGRPDKYGGPQVADSRKIRVQIADEAIPVGQQVVRNEEQVLSANLTQAIQQLQQAAEFASDLQAEPDAEAESSEIPDDIVEKSRQLQDQIWSAEQALSRLTAPDEQSSQRLFQPEIERIQAVTDNEVAEAGKQAGLVPLADDLPQQQEAIAATKESLKEAIEKLENVREDIAQRGGQLELAAQLDELATQQERLAHELDEGKGNVPDVQEEQQQVADALQEVVEQDLDAKSEQFAQRAEKAAELTDTAAELQQQQEALAGIDQARTKEELDDQLLDMIAREQDQITKQARNLEQQAADMQPPAANALEQTPKAANDADQKTKPNAIAKARRQMEAIPEKLKQKDLKQAEAEAQQAGQRLQEEAESVSRNADAQPDANREDQVQQTEEDLKQLGKQQERVADAIKAVREDRPEEAVAKLQEQIAERTRRLRDKADELLQLPTEDLENQQAVQEAREKLEQAEKETRAAEQRTTPQPQEASAPNQAGELQKQTADQKQAGEQQKQAADPKQAGEQQQQAADQKQADEQQKQAADPKQAGEQQKQAAGQKQASEQQKQAAKSLQEATQSLEKVCQSCKKCSNCNKTGSSGASGGGSPEGTGKQSQPSDSKQGDSKQGESKQEGKSGEAGNESSKQQQQPSSQQLAAAADKAHKAARTPSRNQTEELAQELNQLADAAAQQAGYPNRNSEPKNSGSKDGSSKPSQSSDSSQQAGTPRPGKPSEPRGVKGNAGANHSEVAPTQLRGRSTTNWTQSRRKLKSDVLDDPNSRIPAEYRGVVKDYFEELSRLESRQDTPEVQK